MRISILVDTPNKTHRMIKVYANEDELTLNGFTTSDRFRFVFKDGHLHVKKGNAGARFCKSGARLCCQQGLTQVVGIPKHLYEAHSVEIAHSSVMGSELILDACRVIKLQETLPSIAPVRNNLDNVQDAYMKFKEYALGQGYEVTGDPNVRPVSKEFKLG